MSLLLAVVIFAVSVGAGAVSAGAWRHAIRQQASEEFQREAAGIQAATQERFGNEDKLSSIAVGAVRSGKPLAPTLAKLDLISKYPGTVGARYLRRARDGSLQQLDSYSVVRTSGVASPSFLDEQGPQLRDVLAAASATGQLSVSEPFPYLWAGSAPRPTFFLAAPIGGRGASEWMLIQVYGNWILQDSLTAAGSRLRAEIVEGKVQIAGDYLPIGSLASKPPPPISAQATRQVYPMDRYGRDWQLVIADPTSHPAHIGQLPTLLFAGASLLGLLCALLVLAFGRSRERALSMVREATADLRYSEAQVRRSEERFRSIVQYASDAILLVDAEGTIVYQSDSSDRLFGYSAGSLEGRRFIELIHPDEADRAAAVLRRAGKDHEQAMSSLRCRLRTAAAEWRHAEIVVSDRIDDPNVGATVLTVRDVSDRHELEDQLRHQAFHDSLTGLANRALFSDRVEHALSQRRTAAGGTAVLFCDLDDFKTVNDSLGHAAGDSLLNEVAVRLGSCVRSGDTVARLGGDEFAILLEAPASEADAIAAAERILAALRGPARLEGRDVTVGASIGIAVEPVEGVDAEALLRSADLAMYLAKADGKGGFVTFRPTMHDEMVARLDLRAQLAVALDRDEFVMHYQPVLDLGTGQITGVEALIRWQHPTRGLLLPADFLVTAEQTGTIVDIGRSMLRQACRQVAVWHAIGAGEGLGLNFNLSVRQLESPGLVADVAAALAESRLPAGCLTLELTESMLIRDLAGVADQLTELKALGVSLAVDDFGTGYSSLSYLRDLPVDVVKIDRSFVNGLVGADADPSLVQAVVDLAASLGLATVAEGIEGFAQLEQLRSLDCRQGQGFLFARPLAAGDLGRLLVEGTPFPWVSGAAPPVAAIAS